MHPSSLFVRPLVLPLMLLTLLPQYALVLLVLLLLRLLPCELLLPPRTLL